MQFTVSGKPLDVDLRHLIVAGWAGRDREATTRRITARVAEGMPAPVSVPVFQPVATALLTDAETLLPLDPRTHGAAAPMLLQVSGKRYLGLASAHGDGVQPAAIPCARALWPWAEVAERLDGLRLESWVADAGSDWEPCQRGTLADLLPLAELAEAAGLAGLAADGAAALLCGALAPLDEDARPAGRFRMSLTDAVRARAIRHQYDVEAPPEIG